MPRKRATPVEPEKQEKQPDPFVEKLQKKIEAMLDDTSAAYKDQVALIANAIKFLQAKHKIEGAEDDESFFND